MNETGHEHRGRRSLDANPVRRDVETVRRQYRDDVMSRGMAAMQVGRAGVAAIRARVAVRARVVGDGDMAGRGETRIRKIVGCTGHARRHSADEPDEHERCNAARASLRRARSSCPR